MGAMGSGALWNPGRQGVPEYQIPVFIQTFEIFTLIAGLNAAFFLVANIPVQQM